MINIVLKNDTGLIMQ